LPKPSRSNPRQGFARNACKRGLAQFEFLGPSETLTHHMLARYLDRVIHTSSVPAGLQPVWNMTESAHMAKAGDQRWSAQQPTSSAAAIRIIQGLDSLDGLAHAWDLLATQSGSPMQGYAWYRACAATFATDWKSYVVTVGSQPHITAIAPLVRRQNGRGRLELLGDELGEPVDFVFAERSALIPLAEALAQSGLPLLLKRVPADSPLVAALRSACRWRGVVVSLPAIGSPWIALDAGWTSPESRVTSSMRSHLKRARRLAEKIGPVTCEVLSPTPDELVPLLEEAFRVEAAGWKGRLGSALACDTARGVFFRRYAALAAQKGILRLCFLRIGGQAAAMQFAVEDGHRFWLLKIGYDESFARCSPGSLLTQETVRYAAGRGLRSYEFLGIVEPWTQRWTRLVRPYVSVRVYPAGGKGMAVLATDVIVAAKWGFRNIVRGGLCMEHRPN
jgi:CelD/BcsL family acetyltransferase involved in cellulose biosynthesis